MNMERKKSNVTSLENQILDQIQAFHLVTKQLSKDIEQYKKMGGDPKALEESLNELQREFEQLSKRLDELDSEKN
ncbi:MAG: hypothetical protein US50_C0050G0018 [Candidatus Nomurabacteria bacterium GW2011_GWB1_37_5]|uniref:Uncharacterized protein n=1 Tax=Candidatus Nomurabacteria bacterium GW2011_GWB1_37_5 TaxID=1618742 RepID=A0A0G0H793_9BACT|nr:MAG: hypothetical protein US50_C0050G0018 [Candidatus Nomurabacteria bacterium GW2011_GWB1_37_5]